MSSLFLFSLLITIQSISSQYGPQNLFDYISESDPLYTYNDTGVTFEGANEHGLYKGYILNMTSGQYLNASIVSRYIWWHYIVIIIPKQELATTEHAFFWTASANAGSCDSNKLPNAESDDVLIASYIATHARIPCMVIFTNPSQPIIWNNDPTQKKRSNDALLAYSFNQTMFFGYPPLFFPMVRANIRALDTIQDYTSKTFGWNIRDFAAAGASKWGWNTWLFSAVEDRVTQFVVDVFDMLMWNKNAHHMYTSYGGWTWAIEDYWECGLTAYLDTQMEADLMAQIDPYVYREYYQGKPKLIISDGRDEFFMPDDTWIWWDDMTEPKYYLFVPDTDHAGITGLLESLPAISTFVYSNFVGYDIPYLNWTLDHETYTITAKTKILPTKAHAWHAPSCIGCNGRRDWRALTLDDPCLSNITLDGKCYNTKSLWVDTELQVKTIQDGYYIYEYSMNAPETGYIAFMLDFRFNISHNNNSIGWPIDIYGEYELSTQTMIVNGSYPFNSCSGIQCNGTLV